MKKKWMTFVLITTFVFILSSCNLTQTDSVSDLEKPVFVKMLIYEEDMDAELYYICDSDWDKAISKVELVDAPEGIGCRLYGEETEHIDDYDLVNVQIGVSSDHLNKDSGLSEDLEINKVDITWDDGSKSTEDIGRLVMTAEDLNSIKVVGDENSCNVDRVECTFTTEKAEKRIEFTGIEYPLEELEKLVSDVKLNNTSLSEINADHPLVLRKGEQCKISLTMDRSIPYGKISARAKLMEKDGNKEMKYTNLSIFMWINDRFSNSEDIAEYLESVL